MQNSLWREDNILDLQRMPRKTGSDTSADYIPPQCLQRIYGENLRPVVIMEDPLIHTLDHPFCSIDPGCPCHESPELIAEVAQKVAQGLLTPAEATRLVQGQQV